MTTPHSHLPHIVVNDRETIVYKHENGNGGFILATVSEGSSTGWWYQVLVLRARGEPQRYLLPHAAKLYRQLKREGVLSSYQTFRRVAV